MIEYEKGFQPVKELDDLLKCGICYEFFKTTLVTPCSHNYCSYCIRQSLLYRNQCPSCFEEINESQLRPNRLVDNVLAIFVQIRDKLLNSCSKWPIEKNASNRANNPETSVGDCITADSVASSSKGVKANLTDVLPRTPAKQTPSTSKKEVRIPSIFSPKKKNPIEIKEVTKVACPVCSVEISEVNINTHLDACLKRCEKKSKSPQEKRNPLPKLVYSLLSEKELRKKLSNMGLSSLGDRKTIVNRHRRYTLLYNSECDSLNPRPVAEILKQLKKEEEDEKKSSTQAVKKLNVDRKADPQMNEEAQRQYLQEHKTSFERLVEEARRNKNISKKVESLANRAEKSDIITIDELSSDPSDTEFKINRPSTKRKLITSDSDSDEDVSEEKSKQSTQVVEVNVHSHSTPIKSNRLTPSCDEFSNKENDSAIKSKGNIENNKIRSRSVYSESTDDELSPISEVTPKKIFETVATKNKMLKDLGKCKTPVKGFTSVPSVTSPVLSSVISKTPRLRKVVPDKNIRDLSPDLVPRTVSPASSLLAKSPAGHELEDDVVDSDSSSNHSASLMLYTGPDCGVQSDQGTPTKSPVTSPVKTRDQLTKPDFQQYKANNFDLGIDDMLENSEEFETLSVRRQSRRIKGAVKTADGTKSKTLRKRVKIDDL